VLESDENMHMADDVVYVADQKPSRLVRGSSAVTALLGKLPSTQHSPESFVVDVAVSLVMSIYWLFVYVLAAAIYVNSFSAK